MRSSLLFPRIRPRVLPARLTTPAPEPSPEPATGHSVVEFGAYIGGEKITVRSVPEAVRLVREHNAEGARDDAFVWVGLHEPAAPEVEWLGEVFGLHPLAVEDAIKAHQRPKVERYGDSLFVVLKTVSFREHDRASGDIIDTGEIMIFVGHDFVVTVRHGDNCPLGGVRQRLEGDPKWLRRGPTGVLHAIADHVVDKYLQVVDLMQAELEEVEAAVFAEVSSRDINRIYQLKREMLELKRAVQPLQAPFDSLPQRRIIPSAMREYFRDIGDHLSRVCEQVQASNELSDSILQAALARSNALANEDMRKISSWVAIISVPTMIAGIYGMNFTHMPELDTKFGYPVVLGVMVIACTLLHRAFRRNGWL